MPVSGPISMEAYELALYCSSNREHVNVRIEWGKIRNPCRRALVFCEYVTTQAEKYCKENANGGTGVAFTTSDIYQASMFVCEYYESHPG